MNGNDCISYRNETGRSKVKIVWSDRIEKSTVEVEEKTKLNARNYVEKQALFLADCKDSFALQL